MKTFPMAAGKRCECGQGMEAATSVGHNDAPQSGKAVTICVSCARLYLVGERLELEPFSWKAAETALDADTLQKLKTIRAAIYLGAPS